MFSLLRKSLTACVLLALLCSNVLTLTSSAFNTALSGALTTALGVKTVTGSLEAKLQTRKAALARQRAAKVQRTAAARRFGSSLVNRSRRVAARSVAAIPVESVPYIGVAAIVAGTAYELYAMCETLQDMETLYAELGIAEREDPDAVDEICRSAVELGSADS